MDVLMPQLGETVAEGKIVRWFKNAGDMVAPGDNLFEIETDKTSMEVPATFGGTLSAINFQVGEVAKVGAVVAVILGEGEAPVASVPQAQESTSAPVSPPLIPAQAGIRTQELGPRGRGDERTESQRVALRRLNWIPSAKSVPRNAISARRGSRAALR